MNSRTNVPQIRNPKDGNKNGKPSSPFPLSPLPLKKKEEEEGGWVEWREGKTKHHHHQREKNIYVYIKIKEITSYIFLLSVALKGAKLISGRHFPLSSVIRIYISESPSFF